MLKKINKTAKIKYISVKKSKCYNKELKLSYKQLETIVEMGQDYLRILEEKIKEIDENKSYKLALYNYKKEEILEIVNYIAQNIGYCKECKIKKKDDVGLDPLSAASILKGEK
ncbi:hypothetical protein ACTQ4P_12070 [Clostridium sporogenes]|uniref:hypothetical protein n=1 Tax=Clostridium sporogenes TaxID=1509 RepID=UPI0006686096|nr:hypothetical protein [Clostridium sporogenes]MDU1421978.1 hypothetical protein [Clostridium botulinum]NFG03067.1 hypothetical protein [Clostridium sporogenes]